MNLKHWVHLRWLPTLRFLRSLRRPTNVLIFGASDTGKSAFLFGLSHTNPEALGLWEPTAFTEMYRAYIAFLDQQNHSDEGWLPTPWDQGNEAFELFSITKSGQGVLSWLGLTQITFRTADLPGDLYYALVDPVAYQNLVPESRSKVDAVKAQLLSTDAIIWCIPWRKKESERVEDGARYARFHHLAPHCFPRIAEQVTVPIIVALTCADELADHAQLSSIARTIVRDKRRGLYPKWRNADEPPMFDLAAVEKPELLVERLRRTPNMAPSLAYLHRALRRRTRRRLEAEAAQGTPSRELLEGILFDLNRVVLGPGLSRHPAFRALANGGYREVDWSVVASDRREAWSNDHLVRAALGDEVFHPDLRETAVQLGKQLLSGATMAGMPSLANLLKVHANRVFPWIPIPVSASGKKPEVTELAYPDGRTVKRTRFPSWEPYNLELPLIEAAEQCLRFRHEGMRRLIALAATGFLGLVIIALSVLEFRRWEERDWGLLALEWEKDPAHQFPALQLASNAVYSVDGTSFGWSDFPLRLRSGKHLLAITGPMLDDETHTVPVPASGTVSWLVRMNPKPAHLRLRVPARSLPAGGPLEVEVDSGSRTSTFSVAFPGPVAADFWETNLTPVPFGEARLRVRVPDHKDVVRDLRIVPGEILVSEITFEPLPGVIILTNLPAGTHVNGVPAAPTAKISNVVRETSLRLEVPKHRTTNLTVRLDVPGQEKVLFFDDLGLVPKAGRLEWNFDFQVPPSLAFPGETPWLFVGKSGFRTFQGNLDLPEGVHEVRIEHPYLVPVSTEVAIVDRETHRLRIGPKFKPAHLGLIRPVGGADGRLLADDAELSPTTDIPGRFVIPAGAVTLSFQVPDRPAVETNLLVLPGSWHFWSPPLLPEYPGSLKLEVRGSDDRPTTIPSGSLSIDRKQVAGTDFVDGLVAGPHLLEIAAPDHGPTQRVFNVYPARTTHLVVSLPLKPGRLQIVLTNGLGQAWQPDRAIRSVLEKAELRVGAVAASGTFPTFEVPAGTVEASLHIPGFASTTNVFFQKSGTTFTWPVGLCPVGTLTITVAGSGAREETRLRPTPGSLILGQRYVTKVPARYLGLPAPLNLEWIPTGGNYDLVLDCALQWAGNASRATVNARGTGAVYVGDRVVALQP